MFICQTLLCQTDSLNLRELYNMDHVLLTNTITHVELSGQYYSESMTQGILAIVAAGMTYYIVTNTPNDIRSYPSALGIVVTSTLSISSIVNLCKGNYHLKNVRKVIKI